MSSIHKAATSGFFSALDYDTHRPSYPESAVSAFLSALKIAGVQGARIIDLGAGTGKFTEILAARGEGFEILAHEPHDGMREQLMRKRLKGVAVGSQSAENLGVEEQWADAVICAQVGQSIGGPFNLYRLGKLSCFPELLVRRSILASVNWLCIYKRIVMNDCCTFRHFTGTCNHDNSAFA